MTTLREISQIFELNCFIYVSESFALYSAPHHKSEEEYRSLQELLVVVLKFLETDTSSYIWFKVRKLNFIPFFYAYPVLQTANVSAMNPYVSLFFVVLEEFFTQENIGELNEYIRKSGSIFNAKYHIIRSIAPVVNQYFMQHFDSNKMNWKETIDALIKCLLAFEVSDTQKLFKFFQVQTVHHERTFGLFTTGKTSSHSLVIIPERILKKQKILDFFDLLEYSLFLQQKKIFSLNQFLFVQIAWDSTQDALFKRRLLGIEVKKQARIPLQLVSHIYEVNYRLILKRVLYQEAELFQHEIQELKVNQYHSAQRNNDSLFVFRNVRVLVFEVVKEKKKHKRNQSSI